MKDFGRTTPCLVNGLTQRRISIRQSIRTAIAIILAISVLLTGLTLTAVIYRAQTFLVAIESIFAFLILRLRFGGERDLQAEPRWNFPQ